MHTLAEAEAFIDRWFREGPPALPSVSDLSIQELQAAAQLACDQEQWTLGRHYLTALYDRGYDPAKIASDLGHLNTDDGRPQEALAWYRRALALDPSRATDYEHLIFILDAQPETTDAEATAERRRYFEACGRTAYDRRVPLDLDHDPDRPLRVGYVSGDWNFHSAAIAFSSVLTRHSAQVIPYAYSTLHPAHYDQVTRKTWQPVFGDRFLEAYGLNASQLAAVIRHDQIDILVDLSGYTHRNRLNTFAARPAPIQIQAWGYVLGTASPAIDVVFADRLVASPAIRAALRATVYDLPSILGFLPPEGLPTPDALPCETQAPSFVVAQRDSKVNAQTCAVWRQILERVPDATLTFKGPGYSPARRQQIAAAFAGLEHRIAFLGGTSHLDHLRTYPNFDLSLDPWPQTGGVSTLEALWMGVPAVTLIGDRMIQRTSASIFTNVGMPECVAYAEQDYIDRAVALVTTARDRLAGWRATARDRMRASPIMTGYVEAVEAAYRTLWRDYCATSKEQAA